MTTAVVHERDLSAPGQQLRAGRCNGRRIHLWAPGVFELRGGIQVYQRDLIAGIGDVAPGAVLRVLSKNDHGLPPGHVVRAGPSFDFSGRWPGQLRTLHYVQRLATRALTERPDLVIAGHVNFAAPAHALKRVLGAPYWVITYGLEAWDIRRPGVRAALRAADLVLAIGEHTRGRLLETQQLSPARVALLPPTFEPSRFQPGPKPPHLLARFGLRADQPVVLTVARLAGAERYKGYDRILEALPRLRERHAGIRYLIAGSGDDRARIEQRVRELGVESSVTLAGFVPDAELRDFYNLCDVYAMPSKREGFGIVYVEALACGKPVLAGDRDGAVDALAGGALGALVDPDDVTAIGDALERLLRREYPSPLMHDPARLRQEAVARFGPERFRERLAAQLEAAVRGERAG